jgi:hypothetical protein
MVLGKTVSQTGWDFIVQITSHIMDLSKQESNMAKLSNRPQALNSKALLSTDTKKGTDSLFLLNTIFMRVPTKKESGMAMVDGCL